MALAASVATLLAFGAVQLAAAQPVAEPSPPASSPATMAPPRRPLPEPADPTLPSLFIIGDSTVRNGQGDGANGQWGWGEPIAAFFDTARLNVVNRAVGGLSSRTFLTLGHWDRLLPMLKAGDVVVMQFGHNDGGALNDEPPGPLRARGTLRGIGEETREIDNVMTHQHEVVHTYGWYLRRFIADAKAKGVTPIVCSPIPRKIWTSDGAIRRDRGDYAGWAAQVAAAERVGFIDLNEMVARRYDELGRHAVMALFPQVTPDEHTHTNQAGAELNAATVIAGLKGLATDPLAAYFSAATQASQPPPAIPLWTDGAPASAGKPTTETVTEPNPGELRVSGIHHPSLTPYLPAKEKATGLAVLVIPGGGHRFLSITHEGYSVGEWLRDRGIAAFVLKHRLAREAGSTYRVEVESLADVQRALRLIRSRASEWGIDVHRVGALDFSAGGELVSLASARFDGGDATATDPIARQPSKPDFQALIYPGSADTIAPTKDSPPAFLVAAYDDRPAIAEGVAEAYLRFKRAGVLAELHIYSTGGHGFGLRPTNTRPIGHWLARFEDWLADGGWLRSR
jgi:acetyl esterase/lipase/lysophospholipase L1-like esterase